MVGNPRLAQKDTTINFRRGYLPVQTPQDFDLRKRTVSPDECLTLTIHLIHVPQGGHMFGADPVSRIRGYLQDFAKLFGWICIRYRAKKYDGRPFDPATTEDLRSVERMVMDGLFEELLEKLLHSSDLASCTASILKCFALEDNQLRISRQCLEDTLSEVELLPKGPAEGTEGIPNANTNVTHRKFRPRKALANVLDPSSS